MVIKEVSHESGFAGTSSANENAHGVLRNHLHVKLPDSHIECIGPVRHFLY